MSNLGIVGGTSREEALAVLNEARQAVVDAYALAAQFPNAAMAVKAQGRIKSVDDDLKAQRKDFEAKNNWFTLWGNFSDVGNQLLSRLDGIASEIRFEVQKSGEQPIVDPPAPPGVETGNDSASSVPTWVWWTVGGAALLGGILWWASSQSERRVVVLPPGR